MDSFEIIDATAAGIPGAVLRPAVLRAIFKETREQHGKLVKRARRARVVAESKLVRPPPKLPPLGPPKPSNNAQVKASIRAANVRQAHKDFDSYAFDISRGCVDVGAFEVVSAVFPDHTGTFRGTKSDHCLTLTKIDRKDGDVYIMFRHSGKPNENDALGYNKDTTLFGAHGGTAQLRENGAVVQARWPIPNLGIPNYAIVNRRAALMVTPPLPAFC